MCISGLMPVCWLSLPELPYLQHFSHDPVHLNRFSKKPGKTLVYFDFPRKTGILRKYVTVSCFRNHKPPADAFIPDTKSSIPEDTGILPAFSRKECPITSITNGWKKSKPAKTRNPYHFRPFHVSFFAEKRASIKINRITEPDTGRYCIQ